MPRPPTQDHSPRPPTLPTADAPLTLSKSQRKRDAHALRALGVQLVALSAAQLARLDLPEALHEAVLAAQRMRAHAPDAVYRQGDAAARAHGAQPHPHGVGARAGRDPAAPAVDPAGTAQTSRGYALASAILRAAAGRWTVAGSRQRRGLRHLVLPPAQPIASTRADTGWRG